MRLCTFNLHITLNLLEKVPSMMQKLKIKFNWKICITCYVSFFILFVGFFSIAHILYSSLTTHCNIFINDTLLCYMQFSTLSKLALLYRNVSSVMYFWKINKCHLDIFINLGRKLTRSQSNYFTIPVGGENVTFHFTMPPGFDLRFSEPEAHKQMSLLFIPK